MAADAGARDGSGAPVVSVDSGRVMVHSVAGRRCPYMLFAGHRPRGTSRQGRLRGNCRARHGQRDTDQQGDQAAKHCARVRHASYCAPLHARPDRARSRVVDLQIASGVPSVGKPPSLTAMRRQIADPGRQLVSGSSPSEIAPKTAGQPDSGFRQRRMESGRQAPQGRKWPPTTCNSPDGRCTRLSETQLRTLMLIRPNRRLWLGRGQQIGRPPFARAQYFPRSIVYPGWTP